MTDVLKTALQDFVVMLRNNLTDVASRPSSQTDTFPSLTNATTVTLSQTPVRNVNWVKLDGGSVTYRDGYTVDYLNGEIDFSPSVSGSVDVLYGYGQTFIYPGWPRLEDVTLPRISVTQIGPTQIDLTVGGNQIAYEFTETVDVWTDRNTTYTKDGESVKGPKLADYIADDIVGVIRNKRLWIPNTLNMRVSSVRSMTDEIARKGKTARTIFRVSLDISRIVFKGVA